MLCLSGPGHAAKAILGAPCTYKYGQDMVSVYRLLRNAICAPCHKGAKAINEGVRTNSSLVNLFLTVSDWTCYWLIICTARIAHLNFLIQHRKVWIIPRLLERNTEHVIKWFLPYPSSKWQSRQQNDIKKLEVIIGAFYSLRLSIVLGAWYWSTLSKVMILCSNPEFASWQQNNDSQCAAPCYYLYWILVELVMCMHICN